MKNKTHPFGLYLPTLLIALLSTVVMRTVALFVYYSPDTFYFSNSILISISDYTVIGAVIIFFSYIFTARKDMKFIPNFTSPATYIPTYAVAVAILFSAVYTLTKAGDSVSKTNLLISLATAVFAVLSLVHFILTSMTEKHSSTKRAAFGLCTVVFLSLYAVYLYFSTDLPLNAPNKIVDEMAYLFASVFFLFETRLSMAREKWRPYIAFGFIASLLTAYSSVPSIMLYIFNGTLVSASIYENTLTFALFVFITARLFLTTFLIEDKVSKTAATLISFSEKRCNDILKNQIKEETPANADEEKADEESYTEEHDENQFTIDVMNENDENQISIYDEEFPFENTATEIEDNQ